MSTARFNQASQEAKAITYLQGCILNGRKQEVFGFLFGGVAPFLIVEDGAEGGSLSGLTCAGVSDDTAQGAWTRASSPGDV
jgi:hypothetical protein